MKLKVVEGKKKDFWKTGTLILLFVVILIGLVFYIQYVRGEKKFEGDICSSIQGTPAWMQNGEIIGYGEGFPENYARQSFPDVVNDYLIPNKITFIWDAKCVHCQNQIREFKDSWIDYLHSNLTIECHIL